VVVATEHEEITVIDKQVALANFADWQRQEPVRLKNWPCTSDSHMMFDRGPAMPRSVG